MTIQKSEEKKDRNNFSVEPPMLGNLYFNHLNPLLSLASERQLNIEDLGTLPDEVDPLRCYHRFKEAWGEERFQKGAKKASLYKATMKVVGPWKVIFIAAVSSICGNFVFAVPLLQEAIVKSQEGTQVLPAGVFWTLIALTLIVPVLTTIMSSRAQSKQYFFELHLQSALRMAIHAKVLTIGPVVQKDYSIGEITTFFQRDVMTASQLTTAICNLITSALQVVIGLSLVYLIFGIATLSCLVIVVINSFLYFYYARMQQRAFREYKDQSAIRLKMMSEVLVGVRSIKYNAWEKAFLRCVQSLRVVELGKLLRYQYYQLPTNVLGILAPVSMPVVVFFVYIQQGNSMNYVQAFTALMLFQSVVSAISNLPAVLNTLIEATESFGRLKTFLTAADLQNYVEKDKSKAADRDIAAEMRNASLGWDNLPSLQAAEGEESSSEGHEEDLTRAMCTLQDVSLSIERGQLVAIVGAVGSGKTSLLTAFLGEMVLHGYVSQDREGKGHPEAGTRGIQGEDCEGSRPLLEPQDGLVLGGVALRGSVAYHQQQPWVFNATLLDNILFGLPFDDEKFAKVVQCCALQPDIDSLPGGAETEIGERGINLSGGQKARVSLARALYRDADIFLLDDPLSAVDATVAQIIVHEALLKSLRERGKTVLLVTHQIHFLPYMDKVVLLDGGKIKYQGSYADMDKTMLPTTEPNIPEESENDNIQVASGTGSDIGTKGSDSSAKMPPLPPPTPSAPINAEPTQKPPRPDASTKTGPDGPAGKTKGDKGQAKGQGHTKGQGKLVRSEARSKGHVDLGVYLYYLRGGGLGMFSLLAVLLAAGVTVSALANYVIIDWSKAEEQQNNVSGSDAEPGTLNTQENMYYINLYATLALMEVVCYALMWLIRIVITQTGARFFHYHLAEIMLMAPISYYDTTPLGRVLTLFSNDLRSMNIMLFAVVEKTLTAGLMALRSLIVISEATSGVFIIAALPLGVLVYRFQRYYRACNTEVARLAARSYSPIMVEFAAQLSSLPSIRAYAAVPECVEAIRKKIIVYNTATFMKTNIKLWLLMRLNTLGSCITFFCIVAQVVTRGYISPQDLSIAILYAQTLPALLQNFLFLSSQLEANMASAERFKLAVDTIPQEGLTLRHPQYTLRPTKSSKGSEGSKQDASETPKTNSTSSADQEGSQLLYDRMSHLGRDRDSVLRRAGGFVLGDYFHCFRSLLDIGGINSIPGESHSEKVLENRLIMNGGGDRDLEWWEALAVGEYPELGIIIPPKTWPSEGKIVVRDLHLRYRSGPLVLQGLSFVVRGGETMGVVGRTGAGKSSLMVALFGIEKPCGGSIEIDGIDISLVPLRLLRSRMGIVLQDSVMFSNTLRFNIDPFGEYSDQQILSSLEAVGLGPMMQDLRASGLGSKVEEGGANFSQGQRQMITFCRALLKAPPVLLLDEATASLDDEADQRIQSLLSSPSGSSPRTQIVIAHRLHTVRDATRVLVMQDGKVGECGDPNVLLACQQDDDSARRDEMEGVVYPPARGLFADLWARYQAEGAHKSVERL